MKRLTANSGSTARPIMPASDARTTSAGRASRRFSPSTKALMPPPRSV